MKNLRITALFLLMAMLASCGADEGTEDTTDAGNVSADTTLEEGPAPELPDKTYGGEVITMFVRNDNNFIKDFYIEEANGDLMDDAVYERNSRVAKQFDVEFEIVKSANVNGNDAANTILAGDDSYDLLIPHARSASTYAHDGLLLDWNDDLPYVDLDKPWWNQDARKNFSFFGNLYTMIGDISYLNIGQSVAMLFNKAIFDEYSLEYPYQSVLDGDWTFDEFTRLAAMAVSDLNGDTKIDPNDDQMGYITTHWSGPIQVLYSANQRVCEKNDEDELILTLNTERTVDVFEAFFTFCSTEGMYINKDKDKINNNTLFTEGRAMFMDTNLKETMNLRDMEDDFGIIPWPKFDKNTEKYYTNVDAGCNLICVPITAKDPECISVVLEALCYDGYKNVVPTYYEVVLQTKYTRDEESTEMIDLISEGRLFDIGYFYSNARLCYQVNSIGYHMAQLEDPNFASFYAQYESKALTDIEAINKVYREMAD